MKISEMTLEQLQDYALKLEQDNAQAKSDIEKVKAEVNELTGFNKALQKRNNELFMQVEQQGSNTPDEGEKDKPPVPVKTCEEFAREYVLGGKK